MRSPARVVAAPFLVLICGVGSGTLSARQAAPPERPATTMIVGRVLEADSTRPVEDAVVSLSGMGVDRRVMVDEQGRFAFTNLPAGKYQLAADQLGFVKGAYGRLRPEEPGSTVVELADGQRFLNATIVMWRFASITGQVVDEFGEPIAKITVQALRRVMNAGRATLTPSGLLSASTDDRGVFRLSKLVPGDYAVAVPARLSTFPVDVVRDQRTSGVSLGVNETALLGDSRYLQVGNFVLATMSSAPIPPAPGANGRLTVFQTTYYPATLSMDEASVMSLAAGEERSAVDIRLVAVPGVSVSGKVVGPDGPVGLTPFTVVRAGGAPAESRDFETATGLTAADGRFTLLGVPRGRYELRLRTATIPTTGATPKPGAPVPLVANEPFNVGDTDVANVNVTSHPMPILQGRVEMRGGSTVPPDAFELIVEAFDPGPFRAVNPRLDKTYGFSTLLMPGRYAFSAYAAGAQCASVAVNGKDTGDALVTVEHENLQVVFTCGAALARVTGRVRDDAGSLDPRSQVVMFSTDRRHWVGDDYRPWRMASGRANAAGTFAIANLPAGEYFIAAIPDATGNTWRDPKILETLARSATRLTLGAGDTRALDLTIVK